MANRAQQASILFGAIAAIGGGMIIGRERTPTPEKKPRLCLNPPCEVLHTHNNAFCSAKCCRAHRENK